MRIKPSLLLLSILAVISTPASSNGMANEIEHLLSYVGKTPCKYERNDTIHNGSDAAKHIKKKYNYFKDEIDSTEKFIELTATKSTMSGKYYLIHCLGEPLIKSQDWLLNELMSYRAKKPRTQGHR